MEQSLAGKVVLITGGIRGIGKSIAEMAARRGATIVITYRDSGKQHRANRVRNLLEKLGEQVLLVQVDITESHERVHALKEVVERFGRIDSLVLNAAGGLEAGKGQDYAMTINRDANLGLVKEALELDLLKPGSRIVYMTSTWAHDFDKFTPPDFYFPVASTKFRAEADLRGMISSLEPQGIKLGVVVAPLVSHTGAYAIIKHGYKDKLAEEFKSEPVVSPEQVAEATLDYLYHPEYPSGHTAYIESATL